jgi:FkbM family methyltransferase
MTFQPLVLKRGLRPKLAGVFHKLELATLGSRNVLVSIDELGLRYKVPTGALIGRLLRQNGMYEEHVINWITERYKADSGGTFIDVGGNLGWYSCLFAKIAGQAGRVFSFEPEPNNAALLKENLALNGFRNAEVFQSAVADTPGSLTLHLAHKSNPGAHSLIAGDYSAGEIKVPVVALDDTLLSRIDGRVRLMKIDVEGFEAPALKGAAKLLERTDAVILEYSPEFIRRGGM